MEHKPLRRSTINNLVVWTLSAIVFAILCYFIVEMAYPLQPLEISIGGWTIGGATIVFLLLSAFIAVRLYFVMRRPQQTG
jgi:small neutral amino acid transporter SnatA (MarC family)